MYKNINKNLNSGFALEYAVFLMAFVIAITAVLLSFANLSTQAVNSYKDFVLQKQFLDDCALSFIDQTDLPKENEFDITFSLTEGTLIAKSGQKVVLTVEVAEEDGERKFVKYIYGE
ncbi:MAG: hypothetical protein E7370_01765 [Clostridiales bacterium]|nr:hypothetical protein [Clostridiales bacterium]